MLLLSFSGRKTNHSDKPPCSLKCRDLLKADVPRLVAQNEPLSEDDFRELGY